MESKFYRIGEVRNLLACDKSTVHKLIRSGVLKYEQEKPYADRLFPKSLVDKIKEIVDKRRAANS